MSPPFDYVRDVWLKTLARMGVEAHAELEAWGWYPIGKGRVRAMVTGRRGEQPRGLLAVDLCRRGALLAIRGRAVAAELPAHIPVRMMNRAQALLTPMGCPVTIEAQRVRAACPGAGIFLTAEYENSVAGFSVIGELGRSSEEVAEEAALALIAHYGSSASLDSHLGDQILVPAALSRGSSRFTVHRITRHLRTNAWVIARFGMAGIDIKEREDGTGYVTITPVAAG